MNTTGTRGGEKKCICSRQFFIKSVQGVCETDKLNCIALALCAQETRQQRCRQKKGTQLTSSNFFVINENALKIALVDPDTVTMRSGHDPSEMFIFAPDCNKNEMVSLLFTQSRHITLFNEVIHLRRISVIFSFYFIFGNN